MNCKKMIADIIISLLVIAIAWGAVVGIVLMFKTLLK